jgi:hypothetical protein
MINPYSVGESYTQSCPNRIKNQLNPKFLMIVFGEASSVGIHWEIMSP